MPQNSSLCQHSMILNDCPVFTWLNRWWNNWTYVFWDIFSSVIVFRSDNFAKYLMRLESFISQILFHFMSARNWKILIVTLLLTLNLPLSSHPRQAANCYRNFRLVVDEDDLKWVKIRENCHVLVNQFQGNFIHKNLSCRKFKSVYSDVKWCFNAPGWSTLIMM